MGFSRDTFYRYKEAVEDGGVEALERKKEEQEAHGEIETEHPGYLGSQDTFYVCTLKGVGRVYQQTFVDTYQKKHPVFFGQ